MTELAVRFPAESFLSQAEFDNAGRDAQPRSDARFAHERMIVQGLADPAPAALVRPGTCAPCLRTARFSTPIDRTPNGAPDVNWREGQFCDCADRLGNRARAVLHFLEAEAGLAPWSRIASFGPPGLIDRKLAASRDQSGSFTRLGRLVRARPGESSSQGWRLDAPDAAFHIAVSWDHLTYVPPLDEALAQLRRVLLPGGQFVFTLPLRYRAAGTISRLSHVPRQGGWLPAEFRGEIHEIGWDILDRLRAAGFSRAMVHQYWSDELGYLGPFNLLLSASV
jgi:SAM-dependent methyltransferase